MSRVAALLTLPLLLAACGASVAPSNSVVGDAAELATAKCTTPVKDKVRTKNPLRDVVVSAVPPTQLRVSGAVTDEAGVIDQWVCVVSPDAADKPHGLKIDRLITFF